MEENTLLKLLVNREEAYKKIQKRIEEGQKLRDRPIDSEHEIGHSRQGSHQLVKL